ncbi:MAG: Asp-tRNA(Asn)/Glu-tRNA(Gln) amidotransferase subunit GatB [Dehalococcoidia bacterium]|nr:MAG: Asp-tRNA(Asn)/Glu-tRNA(Gln) amidotransferase subunit GatB [Dehalococcoidia bacterium]
MDYETVIGLEVHAQLLTKSKMYCSCSTDYANAPPNTHVCPICLGMPGVLPVINAKAVEYTVMTALALNCTIPECTKFDRKNYCYPDLMKGYQISQYDAPIGKEGWLAIDSNGTTKRINITRVHLEEDVAKLWHRGDYSLIDVSRSGVPLMETVSEPEINSPEEARTYLVGLRNILRYLGVSTGNMEEGSFRCDANISIRPKGSKDLLPKVEVKNMNSFKAVYQAMEYESKRQRRALEAGGKLVQETRGWVEERGVTVTQRSKEYADDYRYFPEPDLPPLIFDRKWIEEIRAKLPELPEARRERFMARYGLPLYDAKLLTSSKPLADYFETCLKLVDHSKAKMVSNWLLGDFSRLLNAANIEIENARVSPDLLAEMLSLIDKGTVSGPAAKAVFEEMFYTGKRASEIVAEKKLSQISDSCELRKVVKRVVADNPKAVADYKAGKQQALTFVTGQVMKATRGRANPALVKDILIDELGGK